MCLLAADSVVILCTMHVSERDVLLPENTLCRGMYLADGAVGVVLQRLQTYRTAVARAVGPVVGTLAPRLDHIETYNRTVVRTVTERRRMMLSAGVGAEYSRAGWMPSAELDFTVDMRFVMLSATVGADNIAGTPQPRIGLKAALPLWSR